MVGIKDAHCQMANGGIVVRTSATLKAAGQTFFIPHPLVSCNVRS